MARARGKPAAGDGAGVVETAREPVPVDRTADDLRKTGRITPMLAQYLEVKQANADCLVLFRLGDFYECFFEDAVRASELLEITLTARGKGEDRFPMAGIPYHAAKAYLGRLVEAGLKVAVVEQVEDPAEAKGLVRREVTRILTPGMVLEADALDPRTERLVAALALGEAGGAVAFLDVSTGALRAAHLASDRGLGDELARAAPRELLFEGEAEGARVAGLAARVPAASLGRGDAEVFGDPRSARGHLLRHLHVDTLAGYGVPDGPEGDLVAVAVAAALRYAARTQKRDAVHADRLSVYHPGDHLVLDDATRANLEVLRSLADGKKQGSLLGIVDKTVTAMGGRRLARWLTWPLKDKQAIVARQDAVAALAEQAVLRDDLRDALREIADLERLVGRLALGQGSARDLKALARSLAVLPELKARLADAGVAGRLAELATGLDGLPQLRARLDAALVDDPPPTITEGGMLRRGFDPDLDELIELSAHGKDWILRFETTERERTGIGSLKVRYNRVFGYYIEVTKSHLDKVPGDYVRRQTMKGAERYITDELKGYEGKVLSAEEKRKALEHRLFEDLRAEVVGHATSLRERADRVADLDALMALAKVAAEEGWCRPVVDESRELDIEEGRHPVVEAALKRGGAGPFVPCDVSVGGERFLLVITGPNMAGKSTVMRQTALIALLAHVGSFVPAKRARVGLCDRIFTRVGASDNLARGQSTFMVEMTETASILNGATDRSLVILDEIGRGTSTYDGVSIAWAVAEDLHDRVRCRTLFATHYHELTDLAKALAGVANYTVAVREWNGQVVFLRKLVAGAANRSYGIQVARLAGLPVGVLDRAAEVLANLESTELDALGRPALAKHKGDAEGAGQLSLFGGGKRGPSPLDLAVDEVDPDGLTPREALEWLYKLKKLRPT